jgi:hypothetical protein
MFLLSATLAVFLAACSSDHAALPTGVSGLDASAGHNPPTAPGCQVATKSQVHDLFAPGDIGKANSAFAHLDNDVRKGNTADAITEMYQEWQYTLQTYYAGNLTGGTSTQTQDATLAFGRGLYCLVGLDGSQLTLGTTPLDPENVVQVVFPSSSDQTVVTGGKQAGVMIPGGTLSAPVTISVTQLPGPYTFPAGPLNTKLDQYGPFFEFKVVPEQTFNTPVVAAACIATPAGDAPPSSVDMAHNVGQGIEILETHPVNFLVCGATALAPQPSALQLARNGEYGRAFRRLGSAAVSLFAPTTAYASASGIGGTTKSFSPFGGVDTAVVVRLPANFPAQPQTAPAGSDVAAAPSVLVETTNGHTPLGGASVTFSITSGGGSVGSPASSTAVTTVTGTSDNITGLASVPNWTLGVGPSNGLTASASFTLPASISGFPTSGVTSGAAITVAGNPVAFSATSTDVIPYQAAGYVYQPGASGFAPGFEAPGFAATPANGWQTGTGAFGSSNIGASCPALPSTVGTTWANVPSGSSDLLLRKSFTLPAWWTAGLSVGIAIDNDFQAFVDGVNVTPTNVSGYNPSTGFVSHENCATRDSFVFPIAPHGGPSHVLAIRARDRGTAAYVDTRVSITPQ